MAIFRVYSTRLVSEYWYCDVEADSEEDAENNYNFDGEIFQGSEQQDFTIAYCEKIKFNKDEN